MARPAIGVMFRREHPPAALPGFARRAEAAGFDELWLVEDCFFAGGFSLSAAALAATERIVVGLGIVPGVARNPAFAAMEIAALAGLHPGRFLPGIGHGVADWMRQIGALPTSQLAALEETIGAVRALLGGETVTVDGRHVRLDAVRLDQPPAQPPPVYAGVMGAKSLRLAGRVADGTVLAEGASDAYVAWARARIAEGAAAAGHDRPHRVVVYAWCHVDPDPAVARRALRPAVAAAIAGGGIGAQLAALGIADEAAALVAHAGADGLAEALPDPWLDRLTIAGDPGACAASIAALAAAGADAVILVPLLDHTDQQLDRYQRDLLPRLA